MAITATTVLGNGTWGSYYTQMSNSLATITMGPWFGASVQTQVNSTRTLTETSSLNFTDISSSVGGSGFITTRARDASSTWEVDIDPVLDATNESVTFTPSLRMQAGSAATTLFKATTFALRIKLIGTASDCRIMYPDFGNTVDLWTNVSSSASHTFKNPGVVQSGGGTGADATDEPTGLISGAGSHSWSQVMYLWNDSTKAGILLRFDDIKGRGKGFTIVREAATNDIIIAATWIPQDMGEGVNNGSDEDPFDYGLEVRPMSGDYYDALRYHQGKCIADGHPAFRKGKLRTRSDAHDLSAFFAMFNTTTNYKLTYQVEMRRISDFFGIAPKYFGGIVYGVTDGYIGKTTPVLTPFHLDAASAVSVIHDLGMKTVAYSIPINPAVVEAASIGLGIEDDFAKDRGDVDITIKHISSTEILSIAPSWLTDANTDELLQYFITEYESEVGKKYDGFYLDAHNAYMPMPNDDSGISSADRGVGSKTWTVKNREVIERFRTLLIATGIPKPLMIIEWPNEFYMSEADICSYTTLQIAEISNKTTPAPAILWNEYCQFGTFQQFGTGPLHTLDFGAGLEGWATTAEVFTYYWSWHFHLGQLPSFLAFFNTPYHFIEEVGESGYDLWFDNNKGFYRHLQNWFDKRNMIDHIRRCQMLRPLAESQPVRMLNAQLSSGSTKQPVDKVHSSVWYEDTRDIVYVQLSNWSITDDTPVTHDLEIDMSLANYAELGAAPRDIYLWRDGVQSLGVYDGSTTISLTVTMSPEEVAIIAMPLTGKEWLAPKDAVGYYVDPGTGSDTNDGRSHATAFATYAKAEATALVNEKVRVNKGTSSIEANRVDMKFGQTWTTYGTGARPIYKNSGGTAFYATNVDNLTVEGFDLEAVDGFGFHLSGSSANCQVTNCYAHDCTFTAGSQGTGFVVDIDAGQTATFQDCIAEDNDVDGFAGFGAGTVQTNDCTATGHLTAGSDGFTSHDTCTFKMLRCVSTLNTDGVHFTSTAGDSEIIQCFIYDNVDLQVYIVPAAGAGTSTCKIVNNLMRTPVTVASTLASACIYAAPGADISGGYNTLCVPNDGNVDSTCYLTDGYSNIDMVGDMFLIHATNVDAFFYFEVTAGDTTTAFDYHDFNDVSGNRWHVTGGAGAPPYTFAEWQSGGGSPNGRERTSTPMDFSAAHATFTADNLRIALGDFSASVSADPTYTFITTDYLDHPRVSGAFSRGAYEPKINRGSGGIGRGIGRDLGLDIGLDI